MKQIAIIIDDLFEDREYTEPASAFMDNGFQITHIGLRKGAMVKGKKKETSVKIDTSFDDVSVDDFDALLIPGGYSPDKLRAHKIAVDFVSDFMKRNKPIFSICHGPQILITADVLKGRKITGWKSIIQDIKNAGAAFIDAEVVVDGNIVSSRNPRDLLAFIKESLKKLKDEKR